MLQQDHDLAQGLIDVLDRLDRAVHAAVAPLPLRERISREQWRVLLLLGDGEGHTMGEVAERVAVPGATATRLIDRLVSEALAHRRPDPLDRRKVLVYLTEAGRLRLDQVTALMGATIAEALAGLVEDDRRHLQEILDRLATALPQP